MDKLQGILLEITDFLGNKRCSCQEGIVVTYCGDVRVWETAETAKESFTVWRADRLQACSSCGRVAFVAQDGTAFNFPIDAVAWSCKGV